MREWQSGRCCLAMRIYAPRRDLWKETLKTDLENRPRNEMCKRGYMDRDVILWIETLKRKLERDLEKRRIKQETQKRDVSRANMWEET